MGLESKQFNYMAWLTGIAVLVLLGGAVLALVTVSFQIWATWYFKSRHLKIAEARLAAELADTGEDDG